MHNIDTPYNMSVLYIYISKSSVYSRKEWLFHISLIEANNQNNMGIASQILWGLPRNMYNIDLLYIMSVLYIFMGKFSVACRKAWLFHSYLIQVNYQTNMTITTQIIWELPIYMYNTDMIYNMSLLYIFMDKSNAACRKASLFHSYLIEVINRNNIWITTQLIC